MTRRDTKAIEAAAKASWGSPDQAVANCDTYLAHLAEHGDDEGSLIVREAATWLRAVLDGKGEDWKLVPVEWTSKDAPSITGENE